MVNYILIEINFDFASGIKTIKFKGCNEYDIYFVAYYNDGIATNFSRSLRDKYFKSARPELYRKIMFLKKICLFK